MGRRKSLRNPKNPQNEDVKALRELIREGLTENELKERGFTDYIISLHFEKTLLRHQKSFIPPEILEKEIIEAVFNGESAHRLEKRGFPSTLVHFHYMKVLKMKSQNMNLQEIRTHNGITA